MVPVLVVDKVVLHTLNKCTCICLFNWILTIIRIDLAILQYIIEAIIFSEIVITISPLTPLYTLCF